jgi:hypothetical protein
MTPPHPPTGHSMQTSSSSVKNKAALVATVASIALVANGKQGELWISKDFYVKRRKIFNL